MPSRKKVSATPPPEATLSAPVPAVRCRMCSTPIPKGRMKAMPGTRVCVACSEKIGGEYELEVSITTTGKPGSLKKTGTNVEVKLRRKGQ